jgi:uncharacterized oligopeptide transporter (OPT) family protein
LLSRTKPVYVLSRTKEEWASRHDNARAAREGVGWASGIITGAAIVMIAVFRFIVLGGQCLCRSSAPGSPPPSPWTRS